MTAPASTYVIGDVHGQLKKLTCLLRGARLVTRDLRWSGGNATLVFIGDFVDRGPDGLACIDLVMRLQTEAERAGGRVLALLGNHDVLLPAAHRFGGPFVLSWKRNGGLDADLAGLTERHEEWLVSLPAMALLGSTLYAHADATFYCDYGSSVDEVNESMRALLEGGDPHAWDRLLDQFSNRHEFDRAYGRGTERARDFLRGYGARRLVHGHTPIEKVTGAPPEQVREPFVYAGGLCVNVDGGMYRGGPGFVYEVGIARRRVF